MFVFSGDFHGPPFTPPADRVDEYLGREGPGPDLDVISADRSWRDFFQKGGYIVAGTAGKLGGGGVFGKATGSLII